MRSRLRNKLLLGYALAIVLLCLVAGIGLYATEVVSRAFRTVSEVSVPQVRALGLLRFAGVRIVSSVTEYVLIETEKVKLGAPPEASFGQHAEQALVEQGIRHMERALGILESQSESDAVLKQQAAHARQLGEALIDAGQQVIRTAQARIESRALLDAREAFEDREQAFLDHIDHMMARSAADLDARVETVHLAASAESYLLLFAGLFSGLIAMGAAMFVTRRVTLPLSRLTEALADVTSGDLAVRIEPSSNDEIGDLARAFNRMAGQLQSTTVTRNFLDKVFSNISEALLVVDTDFRITMCNSAAVGLFGYTEAQLVGMSASVLLHAVGEDDGPVMDVTQFTGDDHSISECLVFDRGGRQFNVQLSGGLMYDRNKLVSGAVLVVRDITASKESERQLIEAKEHAEFATRTKSAFLANMSHEIRTPLNGLLGNAELLAATSLDTRQKHLLSTILDSGDNLLHVINDILDFSKIEAGKLVVQDEELDLRVLVGEVARAMADAAFGNGVEFICDVPPDRDLTVMGDGLRIRQVLSNLVANAIKFTERGHIILQVCDSHRPDFLMVQVIDTGVGVPRDLQHLIFESFSQVGSRRLGGTGLGLAVSRQLVELMGGEIGLHSASGQGATFWFTCRLPSAREHEARVSAELGNTCVLVIDPMPQVRDVIAAHCLEWHCRVLTLASPAEIERQPLAVRSMDIVLIAAELLLDAEPVRPGPDMLPGANWVAMGSVFQEARTAELQAAGVSGFLRKPVLRDELHACLLRFTGADAGPDVFESLRLAEAARAGVDRLDARVLVVDDNAVNRYLVMDILEQSGCRVETAETGAAGLERLLSERFDAALMDCQLPDIDGEEVTRRLRAHEGDSGAARTPVIALTANALSDDRQRCLESGMDDFIAKPFRRQELIAVLRQWTNTQDKAPGSEPRAEL